MRGNYGTPNRRRRQVRSLLEKPESSRDALLVTRSLWPQSSSLLRNQERRVGLPHYGDSPGVKKTSGRRRKSTISMLGAGGGGYWNEAGWVSPLNGQTIASICTADFLYCHRASAFHTPFPVGRQRLRDCLSFNLGSHHWLDGELLNLPLRISRHKNSMR